MDSDDKGDIELKPKIEDVLLFNETYNSAQKEKKHYYGKKRYKNVKASAKIEITNEDMEKLIIDDLNGQYFPRYVKYFKSHYKNCLEKSTKSSQKSTEARIKGNELFAKTTHSAQIHKDIWEWYSKSIAFAPVGSKEIVLAYECRSNLLLHLKKYDDCVKDIDKALTITNFDLLKVKLLCRKMTCFVAVEKNIDEKMNLWEILNNHFKNIDVAFKDEKFLKMVDLAKSDLEREPNKTEPVEKSSNCSIPFVSHQNNIDMLYNRKEIRIVAKRDFTPGEMVVVSKPLVTSFNPNKFYAYCNHCLSFMWAGIPCDECSSSMYCSEECKTEAWNKYHVLECKVLPHINIKHVNYHKMHLSTRTLLKGIREFGHFSKLKEKMQEVDELRDNSKLGPDLFHSDFLKFYASLYTHINSSEYNLNLLSKLAMQACFLVACIIQTCDIFEGKSFRSHRGKELSKEQDIVNLGFVMLKLLISNSRNLKAANQVYKTATVCNKYTKNIDCTTKRHCIRGSFYDIYHAMFEKSCNPNIARCWTDSGKLIYYCVQPIKKMEKITICQINEFYLYEKTTRDKYCLFSIYCQCTACIKNWPVMEKLFEKSKQHRFKIESTESKIVHEYFERNQFQSNLVQEKNCEFSKEEYQQLLSDVNDVVKVYGQPSFASSLMIDYLCVTFDKRYGTSPMMSLIPATC